MKRLYRYFIFFMIIMLSYTNYVAAYELGDYVYFDPVTTEPCNQKTYWTFYDQDTTCYRWNVISDTNGTVKILLDHNIANSSWNNYATTLANYTSTWVRAENIDLLDESTVKQIIKVASNQEPTTSQSIGSNAPYWLSTNNYRYIDGELIITSYGFWTKTSYDDTTAYRVTEYSNNRLSNKTSSVGIRPTITVATSAVKRGWLFRSISPTTGYNFAHAYKASGYDSASHTTYNQMQGSTFTSNNLVLASTLSGVGGAVLIWQSGNNYGTRTEKYFSAIGHCNDMTYNTQENKLVITGLGGGTDHDESNLTLYVINGETSNGSVTKLTTTRPTNGNPEVMSYSGIAYDSDHNYYWAKNGMRIFCLDNNFNVLYSFEAPFLETGQGNEYHKGYIYVPVYEEGEYGYNTNSTLQLYFRGVDYNNDGNVYTLTNKVYVYSAKLNADGTPSKEFGKLYLIYYIPRTNSLTADAGSSKNNGQYGELEGVTFKGDMMYLSYSRKSYASGKFTHAPDTYTYGFYQYDNRTDININYDLVSATYGTTSAKKAVSIHTKDEINDVNGWTTKNVHNLYTEANQDTTISNPTIQDNYNNSTTITISSPTITINNLGLDAANMIIKNIPGSTTFSAFKNNFSITNDGIVTSSLSDSSSVKTGDMVTIHTMNNDITYTVSVCGDYNKDGIANAADAIQIANVIIDNTTPENIVKYASDYDNNGQIKMNDVMRILKNN